MLIGEGVISKGVMGDVIFVYRILPKGPESLEGLKARLQELKPIRLEEEPIGFGLSAIKMTIMVPDEGGKQEELENRMRKIEELESFEVETFTRAM